MRKEGGRQVDFGFFLKQRKTGGACVGGSECEKKVKIVCVEEVCILEREQN